MDGDGVSRAGVEVERLDESSSLEAGTSNFFFRPLREISASGKLEGLSIGGDSSSATCYDDGCELVGRARTLALCPKRKLVCSLSRGRAGLWVYSIDSVVGAYQRDVLEDEAIGGSFTAFAVGASPATALEVNRDESFLCVVCEDDLLFYDLGEEGDSLNQPLKLVQTAKVFGRYGDSGSVKLFCWGSVVDPLKFLAVTDDGTMNICFENSSRTVEGSGISCAAWSPDDLHIAYGSGLGRLTILQSSFAAAFDVDLSHPDFDITTSSIAWLSENTVLVQCMTVGCQDAEEEELAVCFTVQWTRNDVGQFQKVTVNKIDEDSACIALDEEGAPMGTGPYLHHCRVQEWKASIIAHRKSVGDCSISILAHDEASSGFNSVEVLQDGFDDADSLRPAIPLRTDRDEGDDFVVGLQVYTGETAVRVKDPMKEAYVELEKSFPIVFVQTLSSKLFLFSFASTSDSLPSISIGSMDIPKAYCSEESLSNTIHSLNRLSKKARDELHNDLPAPPGSASEVVENSTEAALQKGLPDSDSEGSEEEEVVENSTEAALQKGLPDSDSEGSEEEEVVENSTEAALQKGLPDSDSEGSEEEEVVENSTEAALQKGLPDSDSEGSEEEEVVENSTEAALQKGLPDSDSEGSEEEEVVENSTEAALQKGLPDSDSEEIEEIHNESILSKPDILPGSSSSGTSFGLNVPASPVTAFGATGATSSGISFGVSGNQTLEKTKQAEVKIVAFGAPAAALNAAPFKSGFSQQKQQPELGKSSFPVAMTTPSFGAQPAPSFGAQPKVVSGGFGKGLSKPKVEAQVVQATKKLEPPSFKKAELQAPLLKQLQDSFVETLVEVRQMEQKLSSSLSSKDCDALRALSESRKESTRMSTEIAKVKMDQEQARGTVESLLQKLKVLEKKAQTYSTPSMETDLQSIANTSIGSMREEISNSFSALQETINDVTEFLSKCDVKKYRMQSSIQDGSKQKSIHNIYSTINAQTSLAKHQSLQLGDLHERLEDLRREKSSCRSGILSSLTTKFAELTPAEEYAQPSSPWQKKEKDFIMSSIMNAIPGGPRVTKVQKKLIDSGTKAIAPNLLTQKTNSTAIAAAPAKSAGGAPMPPMPSFGQMKAAKDTMSTFLKKEDPPAKASTPAKSAGGAPMPPMPSFGQMKAAKDTMSTFLKKEDPPAKASTPAKSAGVLPCLPCHLLVR
ncbi:hypothetical protein HOP50_04g31220 [Chloropicon primus]|nr:hypothetical protein HOP50_04g31220 [Chloropicon primus]